MIVKSSVIKSVDTNGSDLLVEFNSGKVYSYDGAAEHFAPLASAPSVGQYFNANVKGKYDSGSL